MATKLLQANLGHTRIAQDLFLHSFAERRAGLGVVSEPYRIPADDSRWFGNPGGSAAIYWRGCQESPRPTLIVAEEFLVAVKWGALVVVALYAPPRWRRVDYEAHLDRVSGVIRRCAPHPVVVAGDFNAKSTAWGSPATSVRGRLTEGWAALMGLRILNEGSVSTCVRPQGESIIDLTWVNGPAARAAGGWKVVEGVDTGSDHLYIEVTLSAIPPHVLRRRRERERGRPGRWALRKLDEDALKASMGATEWSRGEDLPPLRDGEEVEEEAEGL
ncbi:uncharacterized protein LOC116853670 [Odontomachus brunneus]|uniref:uncharacterized protein LOC116853670 n=1 Tax=Odontomachus brunneus TaxID=486640 RepID=UPI0013F22371|nr:uncharacterized protein LOC116853670 [Odontomachus brunneus]